MKHPRRSRTLALVGGALLLASFGEMLTILG